MQQICIFIWLCKHFLKDLFRSGLRTRCWGRHNFYLQGYKYFSLYLWYYVSLYTYTHIQIRLQVYLLSTYDVPDTVLHAVSFNPPRNDEVGKTFLQRNKLSLREAKDPAEARGRDEALAQSSDLNYTTSQASWEVHFGNEFIWQKNHC